MVPASPLPADVTQRECLRRRDEEEEFFNESRNAGRFGVPSRDLKSHRSKTRVRSCGPGT